jgi:peptide/nickel transport system permease protein
MKRLLQGVMVLALVSIISFAVINAAPGDPALALFGNDAQRLAPSERARINHIYGVDEPVMVRYFKWANQMLHGDMGVSYREGRKVVQILGERLPNTILLFSCSILLIVAFSIALGVRGGLCEGSIWDRGLSAFSIVFSSIPAFWFGILCILLFSVNLGVLPSSGTQSLREGGGMADRLRHLVLPVLVMVTTHVGLYARFIQEKIKDESKSYYVRVARANGLKEGFLVKGILKNALIPYVNYLGITIPGFFGGSIVIESLFSWSGLGQLSVKAAVTRDYPLLMGALMVTGIIVVVSILITDIASMALNPGLRRDGSK